MLKQLILKMRDDFASQYARDRSILDGAALLKSFRTARLIGLPGYSMRVAVEAHEVQALADKLRAKFIVEADYAVQTFGRTARTRRVSGRPARKIVRPSLQG